MNDQKVWSVPLGRWGGVNVRIHIFFLLFALLTIFLATQRPRDFDWAIAGLLILFVSVVWHEFWHHRIANSMGGFADECLLMPWGGVTTFRRLGERRDEIAVGLAGPVANLIVCVLSFVFLWLETRVDLLSMLNPIRPNLMMSSESAVTTGFAIIFWCNWFLFLINLVPSFPFDGGIVLHSILAPTFGRIHGARMVNQLARIVGVGLIVAAYLLRNGSPGEVIPIWLAMAVLAIFLFFSSSPQAVIPKPEPEPEADVFGYDFSAGYTSLERSAESMDELDSSPIGQWIEQRRESRERLQEEEELEEDRLMDEILERLHEGGMESLSEDERALLERVSERYRNRTNESS